MLFMPSEKETTVTIPTDKDIKEIKNELAELKEQISEIHEIVFSMFRSVTSYDF